MVVRSFSFVSVFSAVKVADLLFKVFSEPFDEFLEVLFVEGVVVGDVVAESELFFGAFGFVSVGESDEAIAV